MRTRRAENGSPLRQERYASDPVFNSGLKASAVARKCSLLSNPEHRELCLYLQHASLQPGGLAAFAADFLNRYGNRAGSRTMREHAGKKTFDAGLVKTIRSELQPQAGACDLFPLKGETDFMDPFGYEWAAAVQRDRCDGSGSRAVRELESEQAKRAARLPESYPAADLVKYCLDCAEERLEAWLTDFCINPHVGLNSPPAWFCELERSLKDYMADRREDAAMGTVVTSIGEQINDALEYAWQERVMVHINGIARMGKTWQVKQWCKAFPGRVRYVQVPAGNDDISFFREIARALGTASGSAMNTTQIRRQVEDAIQDSGIMLVFDEAHYLWSQYKDTRNSPRRINWLLTAVVNKGAPVAIITTPQFDDLQRATTKNTGWADEQLDGRIAYRLDLPATLPESDLEAIAKQNLPCADRKTIQYLCDYAAASGKYLAGIEAVAKRARFLAKKSGRLVPDMTDFKTALLEVDPALAKKRANSEGKEPDCTPPAKVVTRSFRMPAQAVQKAEMVLAGVS